VPQIAPEKKINKQTTAKHKLAGNYHSRRPKKNTLVFNKHKSYQMHNTHKQ